MDGPGSGVPGRDHGILILLMSASRNPEGQSKARGKAGGAAARMRPCLAVVYDPSLDLISFTPPVEVLC